MSRRANAGFTLLELTVSLAISALALASLTHLVRDAAGLENRLGDRLRAVNEEEALFTLLEQFLGHPRREPRGEALRLAGGAAGPSVTGTEQGITILSRGPSVLGLTAPIPFTIAFEAGDAADDGQLLLRWSPAGGAPEQEAIGRARGFSLRYAAGKEGDVVWHDTWSRPVAELVMVQVELIESKTGRRVSRLIPVGTSLPLICVLRPLLEGCPQWR